MSCLIGNYTSERDSQVSHELIFKRNNSGGEALSLPSAHSESVDPGLGLWRFAVTSARLQRESEVPTIRCNASLLTPRISYLCLGESIFT